MEIKQFKDENLAHYSYALLDKNEIAIIDPSRNPQQYYDFANAKGATIKAVIETHPHADFVSSHLEIHTDVEASIYCSKKTGASYPHKTFDEGDFITIGDLKLVAWNTPGHSPDSISILVKRNTEDLAIFSGDTLFIGDCGRPDLREKAGNTQQKREELATAMFHSLQQYKKLNNEVILYPAHGAGSLCGKDMSDANQSTIGQEKLSNWSLTETDETAFVNQLLNKQPMIPNYFAFDVDLNQKGATHFKPSVEQVEILEIEEESILDKNTLIIDCRDEADFKKGHLPNSINIQDGKSFETWLGSVLEIEELFYLLSDNKDQLKQLIPRIAKIGYEIFIKAAVVYSKGELTSKKAAIEDVKGKEAEFTIIDIRNKSEFEEEKFFDSAINIPLHELRNRINEIETNKKILVHCAAGYRSAIGSSILQKNMKATVYDLSNNINYFK